jgi:hypothetical protein
MSNISNRHTVSLFVAGKSDALSGQRLAKVGYKLTKKMKKEGKTTLPSICVSIPPVVLEDVIAQIEHLAPFVCTLVENAQDGIIRNLYETSAGQLTGVNDDDISISAVIAYLESEAIGGRLTIEQTQRWFDSEVKDNLFVLIAEKLGYTNDPLTEDQEKTICQHLNGYRELMGKLAGGKTMLNENQLNGLSLALEISASDDDTCAKLQAKIAAMRTPRKMEDLLDLA